MLLKFTKMHGLGNDFVVVDLVTQRFKLRPRHVRKLADRRLGIGFDQLLVVEPPLNPDADFRYRIYNADGQEVEQCGNGARCFAKFVRDRKLTTKTGLVVETNTGVIQLKVLKGGLVQVDMGQPELEPAAIPYRADHRAAQYTLRVKESELLIGAVSMGNPHAVTVVGEVASAPVSELGPLIEHHDDFPRQVNAGFMEVVSSSEINLRVHERGVGETRACGSGACAAVVAGRLQGILDKAVKVNLPGGSLQITWAGEGHPVIMTGPATTVFEGTVRL